MKEKISQKKDVRQLREELQGDNRLTNLWEFCAEDYVMHQRDRYSSAFLGTLDAEVSRLKRLLTENTRIKDQPFRSFTEAVGKTAYNAAEGDNSRPTYVRELQELFRDYRRNLSNFSPLRNSVRVVQNGVPFYGCVAQSDEFFAVAAGNREPVLIHFDQWLYHDRDTIAKQYCTQFFENVLNDGSEEWGLVVVNKAFGPLGPWAISQELATLLPIPLVLEYHQASRQFSKNVRQDQRRVKNFVVVYDLIKSGKGLRRVEEDLRTKRDDVEEIRHIILYDYSDGTVTDLGQVYRIFDGTSDARLKSAKLTSLFADLPALYSNADVDVFETRKLKTEDPLALRDVAQQVDSKWIAENARDLEMRYKDKWVAVYNREVIRSSDSLDQLLESLPEDPTRLPIVRFFDAGEQVYGSYSDVSL